MSFLFGPNFVNNEMYEYTKSLLKNVKEIKTQGYFDNLEIMTHTKDTGKIEKVSIKDMKNYYLSDTIERVFENVEFL